MTISTVNLHKSFYAIIKFWFLAADFNVCHEVWKGQLVINLKKNEDMNHFLFCTATIISLCMTRMNPLFLGMLVGDSFLWVHWSSIRSWWFLLFIAKWKQSSLIHVTKQAESSGSRKEATKPRPVLGPKSTNKQFGQSYMREDKWVY